MRLLDLFEDEYAIQDIAQADIRKSVEQKVIKVVQNLKQFIKTNCGPYLKQKASGNLYRSIGSQSRDPNHKMYFIRNVRQDRISSMNYDNDGEVAQLKQIISDLGLVANRNNSVLVGGDMDYTRYNRENAYVIYPIGNFNYTWSELEEFPQRLPTLTLEYDSSEIMAIVKNLLRKGNKEALRFIRDLQNKEIRNQQKLVRDGKRDHWVAYWEKRERQNRLEELLDAKPIDFLKQVDITDIKEHPLMKKYFPPKTSAKFNKDRLKLRGDDGSFAIAMKSNHEIAIHCKQVLCISRAFHELIEMDDDTLKSTLAHYSIMNLRSFLE